MLGTDFRSSAIVVEIETGAVVIEVEAQSTRVEVLGDEGEATARRSVAASLLMIGEGWRIVRYGEMLEKKVAEPV